jgi:transcriptional regulator with XRE-family HTH domain
MPSAARTRSRRPAKISRPPSARHRDLSLTTLGARVRTERERRGLSLEALSARARVSRSMLSAIERGVKAPTVLVLDRVATGLDTSLARLLGAETPARLILLRRPDQKVARDLSGWERRILSPVLPGVEFEFMRTTLGPKVNAGVFLPHAHGSREYVAVESGTLRLTIDGTPYTLRAGDSIYYDGDCLHAFENPRDAPCEYYLAMDVSGDAAGTEHRRKESDDRRTRSVGVVSRRDQTCRLSRDRPHRGPSDDVEGTAGVSAGAAGPGGTIPGGTRSTDRH